MDAALAEGTATGGTAGGDDTQARARAQYGALPYRHRDGALEVLLIASRETRRWVIPKGWPMRGRKPHRAAEREAYEEAGVVGRIGKEPLGSYGYGKRLADGSVVPCEVGVYPLAVKRRRRHWPERAERGKGRWMTPEKAARSVQEPGLAALIRALSPPAD